ncbi:MAG: phosphoenolpyruvate--protein phosphotransferase [Synergistaceae bacterium]|nr:phosphoenolpyruvate--protein phosphotransferase [Synergistaceae bacterium]
MTDSSVGNRDDLDQAWETSDEITILSPEGFHARPAAALAKAAKKFTSEIKLTRKDDEVNAKSLVSVMGLALRQGDSIAILAKGNDAKDAINALRPIIESGSGEAPKKQTTETPPAEAKTGASIFGGIPASPGIAVGSAKMAFHADIYVAETGDSPDKELKKFAEAIDCAKHELKKVEEKMSSQLGAANAAIFGAHQELLDDPELIGEAEKLIASGKSAAFAWRSSYKAQAAKLAGLSNELFAARAADLEDVGRRALSILAGGSPGYTGDKQKYAKGTILIAEDLSPSDTANIDRDNVIGFCTVGGGATSHIAILARSLSLPAIVGIDKAVLGIKDGTEVILDGVEGLLHSAPDAAEISRVRETMRLQEAKKASDMTDSAKPAVTTDGIKIDVAANIGGVSDAKQAASLGCDGVGLLRSEFLFLDRPSAPSTSEQSKIYTDIARIIGQGKPLVVRTIDVGGDKPLPYINQEAEENPFLGVRGIRLCLLNRALFESQLDAILSAAELCNLHVMFPMASTVWEFREAKQILRERERALGTRRPVKIGVMVEVPSVALLAGHFAKEADFLSIGTNDLTQYTLAADRGNPKLARITDGLDPSILNLIARTVDGARENDCWVGVCGGLAGDELAIPVLIGLGVSELSVSAPAVPAVKASVRSLSSVACRRLAREVLLMESAVEVRLQIKKFLGKSA